MRHADCHPDREHVAKGMCQSCYDADYRAIHKPERAAYNAAYYAYHKTKIAEYYATHKPEILARDKRRRRENPNFRIAYNLRRRMYIAVRGNAKSGSAVQDLGCTISQFKLYIENQFEPGMTWKNQGKWHLDHVMPLASFDLTDRSQFLIAANWLNYQPLWAKDNLAKGSKI